MRDMYIRNGVGFLLVFSITSAASLEEVANLREEIIRIKDDENAPIVIVGNKADLEEARAVPRAKGFAVSQRWEAPYYESSARTKSELRSVRACEAVANLAANVDEVFVDLCRQMLRRDDELGYEDRHDEYNDHSGGFGGSSKRRRRRRLRDSNMKCVVL